MSLVTRGASAQCWRKRLLNLAKGYGGRRKLCVRVAKQAVVGAMFNSCSSRRLGAFVKARAYFVLNRWFRCCGSSLV
ncbi:50S ribosomal subunit protein L20 [Candidatus Hodgkinia cicadicola]|nr:50S ribosomal subunit protein L20 [Candidatus Hodgkinia cicadicola]